MGSCVEAGGPVTFRGASATGRRGPRTSGHGRRAGGEERRCGGGGGEEAGEDDARFGGNRPGSAIEGHRVSARTGRKKRRRGRRGDFYGVRRPGAALNGATWRAAAIAKPSCHVGE